MKPKTFTYNQIIQFFIENKEPLNEKQVRLIASKVRVEIAELEEHRKRVKAKQDAAFIKRERKKREKILQKSSG